MDRWVELEKMYAEALAVKATRPSDVLSVEKYVLESITYFEKAKKAADEYLLNEIKPPPYFPDPNLAVRLARDQAADELAHLRQLLERIQTGRS